MSETPPPYGYGAPQPPYGGFAPPDHPKAMTALVLGIVGLLVCGIASPFAWVTGKAAIDEIDAYPGRYGGRSTAVTGWVLGIIGTLLMLLGLVVVVVVVIAIVVLGATTA